MEKSFTLKAYSPLEAIIGFILSFGLGISLLIELGDYFDIKSWSNVILQAILLVFTMLCFGLIIQVTTYSITIKLDDLGVHFSYSKSFLGIKKKDISIRWEEIEKWSWEGGYASANAWSPESFKIKYKPNKTTNFYLALGRDNTRFFEFFVNIFRKEAENKGIKLTKSTPLEETKTFAIIMTSVFIGIIVLMVWFFFFRLETDAQSKETGKVMIPVMTTVSIWFIYSSIKKAFFRRQE